MASKYHSNSPPSPPPPPRPSSTTTKSTTGAINKTKKKEEENYENSNNNNNNNQNQNKINHNFKLPTYVALIVLTSLLFRWIVSIYPHSGEGKPPLYGDYEAQRHWMEITFNLKFSDWYANTTENDLSYWGLDYPLLTAYHSYFMGYVANKINPKYVALFESRGMESPEHKLFMRTTVLISDILIYYPSVFLLLIHLFYNKHNRRTTRSSSASSSSFTSNDNEFCISLLLVLINPGLMLIDHGHFQYNSISLGLTLLAIYFVFRAAAESGGTSASASPSNNNNNATTSLKSLVIASSLFSLALNYKQMELYHALPFFFYLLGVCFIKQNGFIKSIISLACIGLSVILTFAIVWMPALMHPKQVDLIAQILHRIFPFARGLFEDKVANFWCSLSVAVKLRDMFTISSLSQLSLLITATLNMPACLDLLFRPSRQRFLLAIINSSLIFYLFSFQVHEKSILLATVPACLLVNFYPLLTTWFIIIANLSMLPLLIKDGLTLAYLSLTGLFFLFAYFAYYEDEESIHNNNNNRTFWPKFSPFNKTNRTDLIYKSLFILSMLGSIVLTVLILFVEAPRRLPDLWVVAICVYCCAHFVFFSINYHLIQFTLLDKTDNTNKLDFKCSIFHRQQQQQLHKQVNNNDDDENRLLKVKKRE